MSLMIHHINTLNAPKAACGKKTRWLNKSGTAYHNLNQTNVWEIVTCKKCLRYKPEGNQNASNT